jgi:hypothetical protein
VLVLTGYGAEQECKADLTCRDAVEAVERILEGSRNHTKKTLQRGDAEISAEKKHA